MFKCLACLFLLVGIIAWRLPDVAKLFSQITF